VASRPIVEACESSVRGIVARCLTGWMITPCRERWRDNQRLARGSCEPRRIGIGRETGEVMITGALRFKTTIEHNFS
jgi:hypothetical protein